MKTPLPTNEQVEISSDESSSSDADSDGVKSDQPNGEQSVELSSEAWLFGRAKSYQEYMKLIPVPTERNTLIPYNSWMGLGKSIKEIYGQPLHYLTNLHLKEMDQAREGAEDESVPLDMIIHPVIAESSIWIIEEVHRRSASPHRLLKLWTADPMYHVHVDSIFPKIGP